MKKFTYSVAIAATLLASSNTFAQQGFGTNQPDKSAAVEIKSSNKGLLIPRVELDNLTDQIGTVPNANSLLIYNNGTALPKGYYYWDANAIGGGKWIAFATADGAAYTGANGIYIEDNVVKLGENPITENTILDITTGALNIQNTTGAINVGTATGAGNITIEANSDKLFIKGVQDVTTADLSGYNVLLTNAQGNVWETSASALVSEGITWTIVKETSTPNIINLTINGESQPVTIVSDISMASTQNMMITTVNGVASEGVTIINSNTLTNQVTPGIEGNPDVVNNNQLISTVNGVATTPFQIIKENALALTNGNLVSTVNGVETSIPLTSLNSTTTVTDSGLEFQFDGESVKTVTVTPSINTANNTTNYDVAVNPNAIVNQGLYANNGTRITVATGADGTTNTNVVKLGGYLTERTIINTNATETFDQQGQSTGGTNNDTNTLVIAGLKDTMNKSLETQNMIVEADGTLRKVVKSLKLENVSDIVGDANYSPNIEEIFVTFNNLTTDVNLTLPTASVANKGQVINVKILPTTGATADVTSHAGYLNFLDTYGSMFYQGWVLKSNGTNWEIVARN